MGGPDIERLIQVLAKLPGMGPRSARRAVLYLLRRRHDGLLVSLAEALLAVERRIKTCGVCGNLDTSDPCALCADPRRDNGLICVVEDVGDLWALERSQSFKGVYHVLGGTLSALGGVGPDDLNLPSLLERAKSPDVREVILALNATVEGQTTAHMIAERLMGDVTISGLAQGIPLGGELGYLDEGTLSAALRSRRPVA